MKAYLKYPIGYDEEVAERVDNGCGPAGWKGKIVPDTIYGINVKEACKIHDYDFYIGGSWSDFHDSNFRFYNNLNAIISKKSGWSKFLNPLRRRRAKTYYDFVMKGEKYFNINKE